MLQKKFDDPVQIEIGRRYGLRMTKLSPSRASASMLGRTAPSTFSGSFSSFRIANRKTAETTKLIESIRIATGPPNAETIPPAAPGPVSCEVERLISSFEFPSTS